MAYAQVQKVSGSSANFGKSVAINGYYAVIADNSGSGYFYQRQFDGQWSEQTTFTLAAAATTFGDSIAIGDEYFIVGEPGASLDAGRVGVYAISAPSVAVGPASPAAANDNFGSAVAISDDYLVIGASGADSNRGDVYIYIKGNGDTWTAYSGNPITPSIRTASDFFGCAVAINGDSIIVGDRGDNNNTGAIYIFELNSGTDLWEESQKIFASDGNFNDQFGATVSASGGYFVAGASFSDTFTNINDGAAYIYKYGTNWYEVNKIVGIDESSYDSNHFGESVAINGDYIIIGSPDARTTGISDVFYKKRSWNHLKKILGSDSLIDDSFGESVGISGRFIISGAPGEGGNGAIYFYEDPPVRLRLAQEFEVNAEYLPSKASIFLKRIGQNSTDYWPIYNTSKTVIDATNFSTIDYGTNITTFADSISSFTGNGYMISMGDSASTFTTVNYPVRAIVSDTFNLWIRCVSTISITFQADVLIDGVVSKTINEVVANPSVAGNPSVIEWTWIRVQLVLPDIREHILGIKIKENGAAIDKIYIDASDSIPYSEGPDYGESPYLTVHMKVYNSDGGIPDDELYIYDYKNSITQVVQSDWYNFDINVLDDSQGFTMASNFTGNYFLVMSCSGTTHDNFVVWEMADNDEYMTLPSAFIF